MNNGFLRVAAASPELRVADCEYNAEKIVETIKKSSGDGVKLLVLPELCITGYTCGDLFVQRALRDSALEQLAVVAKATKGLDMVVCVGLPIAVLSRLYNAAAVLCGGEVLGVVPKSFLPTYSEFYEKRYFAEPDDNVDEIIIGGKPVPFGTKLLFRCNEMPDFVLGLEICEDLFVSVSPSTSHCLAGATVIANLSASDEMVCKAAFRRNLVTIQSNKNVCGYVYCSAGPSESTGDVVFSAHNLVAENGTLIAESAPFGTGYVVTEVDVDRVMSERVHLTSVRDKSEWGYSEIPFSLKMTDTPLTREVSPRPFIPADPGELGERCNDIFNIQCYGLKKRMEHAHCSKAVIGVSGGLDSTLALLVSCRAAQLMGRPVTDVVGISMPCFGTTKRTKNNAKKLCEMLGVEFKLIDITDTVKSHLKDISHGGDTDTAYENAQARERTQVLMDVANMVNGLVIGTGDLSEQALGWSTYNGDHMSMYSVNTSVPKTLVRHLVRYIADSAVPGLKAVLYDILDTPVSPELLPAKDGEISQKTEDIVGPYELHDFFLFYVVRRGFRPKKILLLAHKAFDGVYDKETILKWFKIFYRRFFVNQFKRSCVPDGPKVGSVSLSPRGDWRMPSDAASTLWLSELEKL